MREVKDINNLTEESKENVIATIANFLEYCKHSDTDTLTLAEETLECIKDSI